VKRIFDTRVEKGNNVWAYSAFVVASSEADAIRKVKSAAIKDHGIKTGWRVTKLIEMTGNVVL
jgi:hypothetical protein